MAQDNDAGISTTFSKLNVDAMEFVPGNFAVRSSATNIAAEAIPTTGLSSPVMESSSGAATPNNDEPSPTSAVAPQPPASLPIESVDMKEENNGELSVKNLFCEIHFFCIWCHRSSIHTHTRTGVCVCVYKYVKMYVCVITVDKILYFLQRHPIHAFLFVCY